MADIFVSYSSDDRERVRPVVAALRAQGWNVWWDREIAPGTSWDDVLEVELIGARCVLVAWSVSSIKSRWVKTEAMEALERDCLVPLRLDDTPPPLAFRHLHMLDARDANVIEAIVRRVHTLVGAPKPAAAPATAHASIAVLPFENLSRDPAQEYFSDGITEALITSLAQIRALKVISRTSVMRFKGHRKGLREIAADLGVERIIEGSVICAGARVRITAQLIDAATDTHEWAESFDRELEDVLAVHDEIARIVAERVRAELTPRENERLSQPRRVDPDAHDLFLRGQHLIGKLTQQTVPEGIALLEESLTIDPAFAPAHAALANALREAQLWGHLSKLSLSSVRARQAAMAALLLDPHLAEAHTALAGIEQNAWNWPASEREFKAAFALNPNFADAFRMFAQFLIIVGRPREAVEAARHSCELEPLAARFCDDLGRTLYRAGMFDEALRHHERALELDPNYGPPHGRIVETLLELGQYDRVEAAINRSGERNLGLEAHLAARRGQVAQARAILQTFVPGKSPWATITRIELNTLLGDTDAALDILENALPSRAIVPYMFRNPALHVLRTNARFQHLMNGIGLPA